MASGEAKKSRIDADQGLSDAAAARPAGTSLPAARRRIRLDRIIFGERLRAVDPAAVDALAVSMDEGELNTPLTVRPLRMDGDDMVFGLVTGGHRYRAAEKLGWVDIDCTIRSLTDDQARMVEIDENLIRSGLAALDRAVFVEVRLQVWARLNPDRVAQAEDGALRPRRGRPANSTKFVEFLGDTPPTMGFSAETAGDLGLSEMTVKNALTIARGIGADARAQLSGTKLAKKEGLLRQLASVGDRAEQLRVVETLVSGKAKTFGDALVIANGREPAPPIPPRPADEVVNEFKKIWKKAPASHRSAILGFLMTQPLPAGFVLTDGADV